MSPNQPSSLLPPPMFKGDHFRLWMVKMKTHLLAAGLWDYVDKGKEPIELGNNPSAANIKTHEEQSSKKYQALQALQSGVTEAIFTRFVDLDSPKEAWDKLKEEYLGSEKTIAQQATSLRTDFEALKMKDAETVKEYADRIMAVVSNMRLIGEEIEDKKIVQKIVATLPERYEAKISSLEDSRDISTMKVSELVYAFHAQEQRRATRLGERTGERTEGALLAKEKGKKSIGLCSHCKRGGHEEKQCWWRPDALCKSCNQLGHVEKVCKNKEKKQTSQAKVAESNSAKVAESNFDDEMAF